jgi:hypothetical protein
MHLILRDTTTHRDHIIGVLVYCAHQHIKQYTSTPIYIYIYFFCKTRFEIRCNCNLNVTYSKTHSYEGRVQHSMEKLKSALSRFRPYSGDDMQNLYSNIFSHMLQDKYTSHICTANGKFWKPFLYEEKC